MLPTIQNSKKVTSFHQLNIKLLKLIFIFNVIFISNLITQNSAHSNTKKLKLDSITTIHYGASHSTNVFEYDSKERITRSSTYYETFDGWQLYYDYNFNYDENDNQIELETYEYSEMMLKGKNKYKKEFNKNKKEILVIDYVWNTENKEWILNKKRTNEYNSLNFTTKNEFYTWDVKSNDWHLDNFNEYKYLNDSILIETKSYIYDKIKNKQILVSISKTDYNENLNKVNIENYKFAHSIDTLVGTNKNTIIYDDLGNLMNETLYYWDTQNSIWKVKSESNYNYVNGLKVKFEKSTLNSFYNKMFIDYEIIYEYENNNLVSEITRNFDVELNEFINSSKYIYQYNNNLKTTTNYYEWDIISQKWIGIYRNEVEYINSNLKYNTIEHVWNNDIDNWRKSYKYEYEFDNNKAKILEASYRWDNFNNEWIGITKEIKTIDENSIMNGFEKYFWNSSSKNWIGSEKEERIYKDNRLVKDIYYNDFTVDSGWVINYYSENIYDELGNRINRINYNRNIKSANLDKTFRIEYQYDKSILREEVVMPTYLNSLDFNVMTKSISFDYKNSVDDTLDKEYIYHYSELNTSVETATSTDISIFPNPSSDRISVDLQGYELADLVIYDILGNEIMSIPNYTNKSEINISNLSIGTYTIQIQTNTGSISRRLLVNR